MPTKPVPNEHLTEKSVGCLAGCLMFFRSSLLFLDFSKSLAGCLLDGFVRVLEGGLKRRHSFFSTEPTERRGGRDTDARFGVLEGFGEIRNGFLGRRADLTQNQSRLLAKLGVAIFECLDQGRYGPFRFRAHTEERARGATANLRVRVLKQLDEGGDAGSPILRSAQGAFRTSGNAFFMSCGISLMSSSQ